MSSQRTQPRDEHGHERRVERQVIVTSGRDHGNGAMIAAVLAVLTVLVLLVIVLLGDAASEIGDAIPNEVDVQVDDDQGVTDDGGGADTDTDPNTDTSN